jgi:ribonuclease E
LRDLAGLIVIDFIDMEENRNNRAVEKRLKDHLKNDRARIQLGRISHFGLMEMSRQRIRASVLESTMKPCPHCGGTGHVRSDSSVALLVVRAIEEFLLKDSRNHIVVKTPASTALYVLNHKRSTLHELEARFGLTITIEVDETVGAQHYSILRGAVAEKPVGFQEQQFLAPPPVEEEEDDIVVEAEDEEGPAEQRPQQHHAEGGEEGHRDRKRRRRRRRRGGRDRDHEGNGAPREDAPDARSETTPEAEFAASESDHEIEIAADTEVVEEAVAEAAETSEDGQAKKRRRGKRGGKRNRRDEDAQDGNDQAAAGDAPAGEDPVAPAEVLAEEIVEASSATEEAAEPEAAPEKPKKPRRASRAKKAVAAEAVAEPVNAEVAVEAEAAQPEAAQPEAAQPEAPVDMPAEESRSRRKAASSEPATAIVSSTPTEGEAEPAAEQPKRSGWWQRKSFF